MSYYAIDLLGRMCGCSPLRRDLQHLVEKDQAIPPVTDLQCFDGAPACQPAAGAAAAVAAATAAEAAAVRSSGDCNAVTEAGADAHRQAAESRFGPAAAESERHLRPDQTRATIQGCHFQTKQLWL